MNKILQKSLVILFALISVLSQAQEEKMDIPDLTLPSPSAFQLGEYGQKSIGLFSGTAQLSIPLLQFKSGNLEIPINVSYSSNGLKVNQLSTEVGLGWVLQAGGVISRIARGGSDENRNYVFPEEDIASAGLTSPMAMDFYQQAGQGADTQTDIYSFNFMNYAGKFVIDNDHKIIQVPKSNLRIEAYVEGTKTGFKIVTPRGIAFYFLEEEITISRISGSGHSIPELPITTAWYLSRIEAPGNNIVYFDYENSSYTYIASQSQTLRAASPDMQYSCDDVPVSGYSIIPGSSSVLSTELNHTGKRLIKISSNKPSAGSIDFNSNFAHPVETFSMLTSVVKRDQNNIIIDRADLSYLTTLNDRIFLQSITGVDSDDVHVFTYINPTGFPERLSFSQDHWGYYNGKSNNYLFPNPQTIEISHARLSEINIGADKSPDPSFAQYGMLSKIKYPTKGTTEYSYEGNTYRGEQILNPESASLNLSVNTESGQMGTYIDSGTITSQINQEATINTSAYFNDYVCDPMMNLGKSKATFRIKDNSTGSYIGLYDKSSGGMIVNLGTSYNVGPDDFEEIYASLDAGKTYTVELLVSFECTRAAATVSYLTGTSQTVEANILSGGLRVKYFTNKLIDGSVASKKRFYYAAKEQLDISSGDEDVAPFYIDNITERETCTSPAGSYAELYYVHLNSNSLRQLYNMDGVNSTVYEYVTESYGGDNFLQGGIEHKFKIHHDISPYSIKGDFINGAPKTNSGWRNGLEILTNTFSYENGSFNLLKKVDRNYIDDPRDYDIVKGYVVKKNYELTVWGDVTYDCTLDDVNKIYSYPYCATNHDHWWLAGFNGVNCIASGNDNTENYVYHKCYGKQVGETVIYPEYIENLDVMEYETRGYWHYLDKETVTEYNSDGSSVIKTTEYTYENPDHKLPTQSVINSSSGQKIENNITYPEDISSPADIAYEPLSTAQFNTLTDFNTSDNYFINFPVQTERIVKDASNNILSSQVTRNQYDISSGFPVLDIVKSAKNYGNLENRVGYHSYDSSGNPLEVSKEDGAHIIYLWGYNDQFPIAKIENATSSEVSPFLGTLSAVDESDFSAINGLRMNLPNAMVTTYEYEPLIGITKITDPKGLETTYHYDTFNRLEFIKDDQGNLIEEYKYNYKN